MRRDVRARARNVVKRAALKKAVKTTRQNPNADSLKTAYRALDKATKQGLVHKNKAARLKSRLSKAAQKTS